jgi:hypothetical protein
MRFGFLDPAATLPGAAGQRRFQGHYSATEFAAGLSRVPHFR